MAPSQETIKRLVSETSSQKEVIEKLLSENAELKSQVHQLVERVNKLESTGETLKAESETQNAR